MSAKHECLSIDGEQYGDLISVGGRVTFYTVRRELQSIDGVTFNSVEEAHDAVRATLESVPRFIQRNPEPALFMAAD